MTEQKQIVKVTPHKAEYLLNLQFELLQGIYDVVEQDEQFDNLPSEKKEKFANIKEVLQLNKNIHYLVF